MISSFVLTQKKQKAKAAHSPLLYSCVSLKGLKFSLLSSRLFRSTAFSA